MFDSSTVEAGTTHLGVVWLHGRNGVRFRFEVRDLHVPAPGAVEIQSNIRGGRYTWLRLGPSGQTVPHPKARYTLTHRPAPGDKLSVAEVIEALKT
ncbi:hypothetical protein SAMN06273572_101519 [Monaibacterium marinum]|uniref:Uncharacterized protein n=1 Tax=Pontivivens marinum TaxID=1690039 RepID=A0A2C9CMC2_9RHOB|nr:hypothetical protein [Monaibacterium marinum]SOH92671.1 hypothetical protein SAMN06273572_101519 [Monaibacterium marinum]